MRVTASDVMQRNVKSVPPDLPLADLERRFDADQVSGYPVVNEGTLRGVVSLSDVLHELCAARREAEVRTGFYEDADERMSCSSLQSEWVSREVGRTADHLTVADVMSTDVISVPLDAPLDEVASLMVEQHIHRVLVLDGQRLVGLVSSLDVVRTCGRSDVEIHFVGPQTLDF